MNPVFVAVSFIFFNHTTSPIKGAVGRLGGVPHIRSGPQTNFNKNMFFMLILG